MVFRRHALVAFVVAALTAAPPLRAAPTISPKVLQCDGSYSAGTVTNHPSPQVRADVSDPNGVRIGTAKMGTPNVTKALWRFDNTVDVTIDCVSGSDVTTWCAGVGSRCKRYFYTYKDPNNSDAMEVGNCNYSSNSAVCATTTTYQGGRSHPPLGQNCPDTAIGAGSISLFTAGQNASFGNAATFSGLTYGSVTYNVTVGDPPATYTLSAWIQPTSYFFGASWIIVQDSGTAGWGLGLSGTGALRHFDSRDALSPDGPDVSKGAVSLGSWHQVHVVRINGTERRFYIDGALVGTAVAVSTSSFDPSDPINDNIYIGGTPTIPIFGHFFGLIDELRVVHDALTDEDIKLEYLGSYHQHSLNSGANYHDDLGPFVPSVNETLATVDTPADAPDAATRYIFKAQNKYAASTSLPPYSFTTDYTPPSATTLSGAAGSGSVSWSWNAPSHLCAGPGLPAVYYELWDAQTGTQVAGPLAASPYVEATAGPNVILTRKVRSHDNWGNSPLSASVTAYALANQPSSLLLTGISTGGVAVSWSANNNPGYTRYELTYSPDNFTVTTSTRVAFGSNFTDLATNLTGLTPGTLYYLRVRAANGRASDFSGGTATPLPGLTGSFTTRPAAPVLTGTALTDASVRWDWTAPTGASGYSLYDTPTLALLASGAAVTYTSATLSVNTRYDAEVEAYVPEPAYATPQPTAAGARGSAYVYTLARAPVSPVVSSMHFSSGVFSWNDNGNPSYTNYELSVATASNFAVVVATIGVLGTTAAVEDLLPGTSYYARVRAFNGNQLPAPSASFLVFAATATRTDPRITVSSAPPSPYVSPTGIAGVWQFDEGAGSSTADGSGAGNTAQFRCAAALCASTPTFASGPAGLGTAASFSGLEYGVVETQSSFSAFADALTVEAWVYPQSASQRDYAGLVAIGNKDAEDFALDVVSGRFRFLATPGKEAKASVPITAGAWTHVVGVYDPVAGTANLYLNGAAAATVSGVAARTNSGMKLSIGNRPSAAGAYTLPFNGRIDSVRVLHRAMTAAEVLSAYQGASISTVTPASPNDSVLVALPPNAFTSPVRIYVSADPAAHPIKIPYATLSAGLAALPAGLTLVPNTLVEVVPIVDGMPFTAALGSSATVSIPFADSNSDNLVDGTVLAASGIRMYTLNTTVNRWEALSTSVDPVNHRAGGLTPHFSVFALFAPSTVGAGLSGVRVYPVPWKPGSGGRFDGPALTFDNLPASGNIHILTLAGERVADLRFDGRAAGLVTWDGRTSHGRRAASGVYFAKIVSDAGGSMIVKFAVEK